MTRRKGRMGDEELLAYLLDLLAKGEITRENVVLLASAGGVRTPLGEVPSPSGSRRRPSGKTDGGKAEL